MKKREIKRCIPVEEIPAYMRRWDEKKPGFVKTEVIGQSSGYDVMCSVFTDPSTDDKDKQIALIIAQHSGMEISGMTTILSLGNFLVSGKEDAEKILKGLKVVLVPCPNPFTYAKQSVHWQYKNEAGVDEYTSFTYDGAKPGGKNPSAELLQKVIDEYKPEILIDCHGVMHKNATVINSLGYSAFSTNRFYNAELQQKIQQAGTDAGFAMFSDDFCESLVLGDRTCQDEKIASRFRYSSVGAVAPVYAYYKYHTLGASMEISWEEDGLARLIKALMLGLEKGGNEYYAGYPARTVKGPCSHNSIRAWGTTAEQRRKSRVELWQKRDMLIEGWAYPEMPNFACFMLSTSRKKTNDVIGTFFDPMKDVLERMYCLPYADVDAIKAHIDDYYSCIAQMSPDMGGETTIENGVTMRVGLPFADAAPIKVMYNGYEIEENDYFGYTITKNNNWVFVDVNIPPDKTEEFMIVTVSYDCTVPKSGIIEFE